MTRAADSRTQAVKGFLDEEHFRFRRNPAACCEKNEVELTEGWALQLEAPSTLLTSRMIADFRTFCAVCQKVILPETGTHSNEGRIVWCLRSRIGDAEAFDPQDPAIEEFTLNVTDDRIEIIATHERGLLHGTHRLEWMMADREGPFLKRQATPHRPAFMPRISNGVFIPCHQDPGEPGDFSDAYLGLMSHYSVNGLHLNIDLRDVFRSVTLPELNSREFEARITSLRTLNRRTLAHGIDLYLVLNSPPLSEEHAIFSAHPETRGAKVDIFLEGLSGRSWYNLCSGSEQVRAAYAEAMETLFSAAPELAGGVMITGGECFYHCFTRPAGAGNGETNCPHCRGKSPSAEVATLANVMAGAIRRTASHKNLYAWPYSAFIWSAKDPSQVEWLRRLNREVSVLSNFDCGDEIQGTNEGPRCFDYNISCIGPSGVFEAQLKTLREQGRPIFAKTETNTTPDAFFLPYLPVHTRWQARFEKMRAVGVAGFIGQWRFFGMNGSLPEELQYRATWDEVPAGDRWLENVARRDFGLGSREALGVVEGWRRFGEAWEQFPYSAMTSGERAAYMRGPFYLGPAHPLIFDVQDAYGLPPSFRLLRGDLAELASGDELERLQREAKPRYVSDLLVTLPYGVDCYLKMLKMCRALWSEGLAQLRKVLSPANDRARQELDVCETIDCHLASLENVVRFYATRDRLQRTKSSPDLFKAGIDDLRAIAECEMINAARMLPILGRDPRIGYGHCYGPVYDAEMVRAKIEQCRYVRESELPRFSKVVRFHVWLDSP
jgi:hypothetical protein